MTPPRCIHMTSDMCEGCKTHALKHEDDRYWVQDPMNLGWVYSPYVKSEHTRGSVYSNLNTVHHNAVPTFRGPQSSAGPDMSTWPVVEGVRIAPTQVSYEPVKPNYPGEPYKEQKYVPYYDSSGKQFWRYDTGKAVDATIQQMPTAMTEAQVETLRAQLEASIHDAAEWKRIADESLRERKAMSKRHHEQLDAMERNQPTTASREEVRALEKRIGDADRNLYIEHLGNMFADGHLNEAEFGERADKANAAKTMSELYPLVADLPPIPTGELKLAKPVAHPVKEWLGKPLTPMFMMGGGAVLAMLLLLLVVLL